MTTNTSHEAIRRGNPVDSFFKIHQRGSTLGREIGGGLVTFFTMAYIVVLNPLIIGTVKDADGQLIGGGTDPGAAIAKVAVATALVAGVVTILMGLVANYPLALAAGLGLNAFVAFGIASKMTWADAMGLIVLEGLIILLLVLTGFRKAVFEAVPQQLKVCRNCRTTGSSSRTSICSASSACSARSNGSARSR